MRNIERWSNLSIAGLVIISVLSNLFVLKGHFHCLTEMNDGGTFYVGAKLLHTSLLYNIDANLYAQTVFAGTPPNPGLIYCRLPFVAFFFTPFSVLPYYPALIVWRILCAAALVGVAFVFPAPRKLTAVAVAISLPALHALIFGQDVPLMLLYIAIALALLRRRVDLSAGVVFSLCCTKFHFLVLTPIAILFYRRFRFLSGFASGVVAEIAISFLVQGVNWPVHYWHVLTMPKMNMSPLAMPNLMGMFSGIPSTSILTSIGTLLVVCVVYAVCRASHNFELAITFCIAGGLLISTHAYAHDCLLLLPALLLSTQQPEYSRWAAFMMSPLCYFAVGAWIPTVGPTLFVVPTICLLVWITAKSPLTETVKQKDLGIAA